MLMNLPNFIYQAENLPSGPCHSQAEFSEGFAEQGHPIQAGAQHQCGPSAAQQPPTQGDAEAVQWKSFQSRK